MGITKEQIGRINELAKKAKSEGLTSEEEKERDTLRKKYIEGFKSNLRSQLNNISIVEKNGEIVPLTQKKQK